jgi:hypothetical protein
MITSPDTAPSILLATVRAGSEAPMSAFSENPATRWPSAAMASSASRV